MARIRPRSRRVVDTGATHEDAPSAQGAIVVAGIAILTQLRDITGHGKLVFPSVRSKLRPISDNTLNAALRRLGYSQDEATAHGFRATASSLLNESGLWHADAIERQLAHEDENSIRRAYARAEFWEERVRMMQWWADKLDALREGATVMPLRVA